MKKQEQKQCYFCTNNVKIIDYKDTEVLKKFVDNYGRISKAKYTNVCATHQRKLSTAIKNARVLALLPFVAK